MAEGKITLYTNHNCPYAHRAHIAINELGLDYEEVFVDLEKPREPWYLEVNPRGLVPSIKFKSTITGKEQILTESAVIAQFLADSYPDKLVPASKEGALLRARINFFVDAYSSKIQAKMFEVMRAPDESEREEKGKEWVAAIGKELDPLLQDANPFFGSSKDLTLAEVMLGPFLLRIFGISKQGEVIPKSVYDGLQQLPNFSKWANAVMANESVLSIWNEERVLSKTKERALKMREAQTNGSK